MAQSTEINESDIAVIGMAGRFPGASNIDAFWENLKNGTESISFFSKEELLASGVPREMVNHPDYVPAGGVLSGIDMFDADFFDYSPREASVTDPQVRLFLECAWQALEGAGYAPGTDNLCVGVYAGKSKNTYYSQVIRRNPDLMTSMGSYQLMISNSVDFLATRTSYKLNLTGPSIGIQTACSTSLVAVHMACQALLAGECDMALAGGVSVPAIQKKGYLYQKDMIASPDGHCRAFDARAQGTVGGGGAGVVLLKPLTDALADRDFIYGVIKGSAVNNDGLSKIGYTAPSVDGQVDVVTEAQAVAEINPETISYIEAHGTGTKMGDPVEIAALTQAFRKQTDRKSFCALGSLKTNVGHLDTAAGVAGLIKAVLSLQKGMLPPSLHFNTPNPAIDFENSPFFVNDRLRIWETEPGGPRRAGVSSFGIGGTNAHVILEEAPARETFETKDQYHLLMLSAGTESALNQAMENLADHLRRYPDTGLQDVAYTLCVGRKAFGHRAFLVCRDPGEAVDKLSTSRGVFKGEAEPETAGEQGGEWAGRPGLPPDERDLMAAGGRWLSGADIDAAFLYPDLTARRIPLPTYPFERRRYWVEPQPVLDAPGQEPAKKEDISDWFYVPSWKRLPPPVEAGGDFGNVLLFMDDDNGGGQITHDLADRLAGKGRLVMVMPGKGFEKLNDRTYRIDPDAPGEYKTLMSDLWERHAWPDTILHLWSLTRRRFTDIAHMDEGLSMGCHSLSSLVKAVGELGYREPLNLAVVTNGTQQVTGEETLDPVKAAILGPAKVIPLEYPYMSCRTIDMVLPEAADCPERITGRAEQLYQTLCAKSPEPVVALRGAFAWTPAMEPRPMKAPGETSIPLKHNGVYLITGGLGGIGLTLAAEIARWGSPKLILTGRSDFPSRDRWADWLIRQGEADQVSIKIRAIMEMEASGATVYPVNVDVAEPMQISEILHWVSGEFGPVDGVIHSAGLPDFAGMIQTRSKADDERVMAPKIRGTLLLADYFKDARLDFFILCSSLSTVVFDTQFGQSAYVAANEFLDVFAARRFASGDPSFLSVNWDTWREVGMAVDAVRLKGMDETVLEDGILPHEGAAVFRRLLANPASPRVVVSTRDPGRYKPAVSHPGVHMGHAPGNSSLGEAQRSLSVMETLSEIWQECFGVEDIGADEDFFDMGGDSLQGTRVMSRITELLGIDLAVDVLFENPTIQSLAAYIEGLSQKTTEPEKPTGSTEGQERKVISL